MTRADLSGGLFVAGAHQVDLIDSTGVVVAQAPRGIHTQAYDADWKRIAPFLASSTKMLRELQQLAQFAESRGRDVSSARRLIADAVHHVPELESSLEKADYSPGRSSPARSTASTVAAGAGRAAAVVLRPACTYGGPLEIDCDGACPDEGLGCAR